MTAEAPRRTNRTASADGGRAGSELATVLRDGLARTGIPGAVALVARPGRPVRVAAQGLAATHDATGPLAAPRPMRPDTLFDVASLTKVLATSAVAMALVDRGRLDLDDRACRYLPSLRGGGAEAITLADLLEHRAGVTAWYPLFLFTDDPAETVELACRRPLVARPGTTRVYSDLGMLLLGAVLERAADEPLDRLVARLVFEPLGMASTGFRPGAAARRRAAATSTGNPAEHRLVAGRPASECEGRPGLPALDRDGPPGRPAPWREHTLVGEVNDANAALAMRGVAGHAGLFTTARDVARFAHALLAGGSLEGRRLWSSEVVARFLRPGRDPAQGLGVWLQRASAALGMPPNGDDSFGHRGFTGCELAASPSGGWVAVLLTNRLHAEADPPPDHTPLWRGVLRLLLDGA